MLGLIIILVRNSLGVCVLLHGNLSPESNCTQCRVQKATVKKVMHTISTFGMLGQQLLTLSAHAQRVTVVVESVCLFVCLSVTPI